MKGTTDIVVTLTALLTTGLLAQEGAVPAATPPALSFADNGQSINMLAGRGVAITDFHGDGFLDVFAANENTPDGQGHRVYLGDGRGRLADNGQSLANPTNWYGRPAIGDVNGDGRPDALTGKTVWLNDGRGRLEEHAELVVGVENGDLAVAALADLNRDGSLDVFAIHEWKSIRVFLNDGKGHFRDSGQRLGLGDSPSSAVMASVALGDVDGDGAIDAVVGGWRSRDRREDPCPNRVWMNDGTGVFRDSGQIFDQDEPHVHDVALGDVNGDGHLDLVMALVVSPERAGKVYFNDGRGRFRDSGQSIGRHWAHGVALGDLDGNGSVDIVLACGVPRTGTPNEAWLNDGNGTFHDSGLRLGKAFSADVVLGDLNGDAHLDAVVANLRLVDSTKNPPIFGGVPLEVWLNTTFRGAIGDER